MTTTRQRQPQVACRICFIAFFVLATGEQGVVTAGNGVGGISVPRPHQQDAVVQLGGEVEFDPGATTTNVGSSEKKTNPAVGHEQDKNDEPQGFEVAAASEDEDDHSSSGIKRASYGVDVSFPMHHGIRHPPTNPLGNKRDDYRNFMKGCSTKYGIDECVESEMWRMEGNRVQPRVMKNYTTLGFQKFRAPPDLYRYIRQFWDDNRHHESEEDWLDPDSLVNSWDTTPTMVDIHDEDLMGGGDDFESKLFNASHDLIESWTGQTNLKPAVLYGIRVYKDGSVLAPHIDQLPRISSAIINVDQDVDEDWILEVIGHDGRAYNVTMEPGDMVLYESHSVIHGRPFALKGRYFANAFIHFEPVDEEDEDERHKDEIPPYVVQGTEDTDTFLEYRRKELMEGDEDEESKPSYGVDVSFPMHHGITPSPSNPLGARDDFYVHFMRGCSRAFGSEVCTYTEEERLEGNRMQPMAMKNFTELGFKKLRAPKEMYDLMLEFWKNNQHDEKDEDWEPGTTVNIWDNMPTMVSFEDDTLRGGGDELKDKLFEASRGIIEQWTHQKNMVPSALYGIRVYKEGAVLSPHVDQLPRISSAIINIDQDVDEDWVLEVIGHDQKAHNLTLRPGDMILYESHSVIHGRPFPLKGRFFANVFIHFEPLDSETEKGDGEDLPFYFAERGEFAEQWLEEKESDELEESRSLRATEVREAAFDGDLDMLREIAVEDRTLLFEKDENGWNALHEACRSGSFEAAEFIILQGADVDARTDENHPGTTPLGWALEEHGADHPVLELLIRHGATPIQSGDRGLEA